jgi:hypothetical protein
LIRHNYDLDLKKKLQKKKKFQKKKISLRTYGRTDGQPKTIVRNLTKNHKSKKVTKKKEFLFYQTDRRTDRHTFNSKL